MQLNNKIDNWIFDLDNTLYSADSGIFQQVHKLMGKFIVEHLNVNINEAKNIQRKYYKKHGTTLRGLMDHHGIDPDSFLEEVHNLDYSIVSPNLKLAKNLENLILFVIHYQYRLPNHDTYVHFEYNIFYYLL